MYIRLYVSIIVDIASTLACIVFLIAHSIQIFLIIMVIEHFCMVLYIKTFLMVYSILNYQPPVD